MSPVILASCVIAAAMLIFVWLLVVFRRVVPTNMVHIVQSSKSSVPYGRSSESGNTYYEWPSSIPVIGVTVTSFPESIFEISLEKYEAYDSKRLPFVVTISAFFRIKNATEAAQRVSSFKELENQLSKVVQGAVRRVLANHELNAIMQMRSELGASFTKEVIDQVSQWGVIPVKDIEFMNLSDASGSSAISDIMEMEQSRIGMQSRSAIAENKRKAEIAEIEAARQIDLSKEEARSQVGARSAQVEQSVGVAKEKAKQEVATERRTTIDREMEVKRANDNAEADIAKQVATTRAQEAAQVLTIGAQAELTAAGHRADAYLAEGKARAESEALLLKAPVSAQLTLAEGIGANPGYQSYLVSIERVAAEKEVGIKMAEALAHAKLHVIANGGGANGGGNIMEATNGLLHMFNPTVGTQMAGMATAMSATAEGEAMLKGLSGSKLTSMAAGTAVGAATGSAAAAAATAAILDPTKA